MCADLPRRDNRPSPSALAKLIAAVLALAGCGGDQPAAPAASAPAPAAPAVSAAALAAPAPHAVGPVNQLLQDARRAFDEGRLATPAGNNALEFYLEVLAQEPNNADALRSLETIVTSEPYNNALDLYFQLLAQEPNNADALQSLDIIATSALRTAEYHLDRGDYGRANYLIARLDRDWPKAGTLSSLRQRIERTRRRLAWWETPPAGEPPLPTSAAPSTTPLPDGAPPSTDPTSSATMPIPHFPWPPAQWSAQTAIPRAPFSALSTLGETATALVTALDRAGYAERSFYRAPGGFAIVARLERIDDNGKPDSSFRFLSPKAEEPFDLGVYILRLFFSPEGYYRQIVFVVSDKPFSASEKPPTVAEAESILARGATGLSEDIEAEPMTPRHQVTALIYEFRKGTAAGDVVVLNPGRLDAHAHLGASGIAAALESR